MPDDAEAAMGKKDIKNVIATILAKPEPNQMAIKGTKTITGVICKIRTQGRKLRRMEINIVKKLATINPPAIALNSPSAAAMAVRPAAGIKNWASLTMV
jgi:hypothetical protein